jgi:hypothetical protein
MWDIYGKSGFVLRFEQEYFQQLIKDSIKLQKNQTEKIDLLIAGTVQYQNYDEMLFKEKESLIKFSTFRKHIAFKHETEYRIVGFMKEILDLAGLKFLPELKDLKFEIIANPRLDSFQFAKYYSMIF